jgi:hypothetical protein
VLVGDELGGALPASATSVADRALTGRPELRSVVVQATLSSIAALRRATFMAQSLPRSRPTSPSGVLGEPTAHATRAAQPAR